MFLGLRKNERNLKKNFQIFWEKSGGFTVNRSANWKLKALLKQDDDRG